MTMNHYIADVPMKFSDKYLSLQAKNQTIINDVHNDDQDLDKYKFTDYKFSAELVAIEMFELHQKKILENTVKSKNENLNRIAQENFNAKKNFATTVPSSAGTPIRIANQNNNLFYNMIYGEILQPQPLNKSVTNEPQKSVHSECDKPSRDIKSKPNMKKNLVREFENDDSSPFDNVELQTIDDKQELNNVFRALNNASECNTAVTKTSADNVVNNADVNSSSAETTTAALTAYNFYPINMQNSSSNLNGMPGATYDNTTHIVSQQRSIPIVAYDQFRQHPTTNHTLNNASMPTYSYSTFNSISYDPHFNMTYPSPCNALNSQFEMKRSSSEKKNLSDANHDQNLAVSNSGNPVALRSTKSVSDLSDMSKSQCNSVFSTDTRTSLIDRARTPPPAAKEEHVNSKPISLPDPYESLAESEKRFVDNLCHMGFKRDRVSRAVKHINIEDDKKIFEYLFSLQQLEDQGYNCYESEIALHMNNYSKERAENFLKTLKQICDFGFDKESAIKALFKSNNERDKAIDLLLNSHR